ncbi:MAG: LuxR family transcriptional [Geobacteraceae bacterium]|nr:MAG: LuxR family transcriptional [Geobacteraceae bacterium]
MSIKVLLAEDHKLVREGLRALLEKEPSMDVVAEADNGREAIQLTRQLHPDVVVMDLTMPDMNGIEATRRIVAGIPEVRVLALSMHSDKRFVQEAINAGAKGYLLKDVASEELLAAVRTVAAGKIYLCSKIAGVIVEEYKRWSTEELSLPSVHLSSREREVLQLLAEGKSTKDTAFTLGVSVKTVETHRQQVMKKLKVSSVAELTKYAIREGLTSLQ